MESATEAPALRTLPGMRIDEEKSGPVVVLIPSGDMDATVLPAFESRLEALIEEGVRAVLWDLEQVKILPSIALGFLLGARRRLERVGGHMALARPSRLVRSTLGTMGVLEVFPPFDSLEAGVADLRARLGSA